MSKYMKSWEMLGNAAATKNYHGRHEERVDVARKMQERQRHAGIEVFRRHHWGEGRAVRPRWWRPSSLSRVGFFESGELVRPTKRVSEAFQKQG